MRKAIVAGYAALLVSLPLIVWLVLSGRLPGYAFVVVVIVLGIALLLLALALGAAVTGRGSGRERLHVALLGAALLAAWFAALLIDYAD